MEHGLLAIALYKLANICKLLSSCGFFRLESFQLTHYIRACKFDSKQLTLYCKLLKFWNLRSMHASYPLLWIDWFFLNCLFFIIRNSFFNELDGACFFIKLFLPHFKYFHLENCRFDGLGFFLPLIPKFNPSKQARNGSHCGGAYSEAWMSAVGRYTGHPPLMFTDSQINNILWTIVLLRLFVRFWEGKKCKFEKRAESSLWLGIIAIFQIFYSRILF